MSNDNQTKRRWSGRSIIILISIVVVGIIVLGATVLGPAINRIYTEGAGSNGWCPYFVTAVAWIDADGDAERDAEENPLANVQFFVDELNVGRSKLMKGVSDTNGNVKLTELIPGCGEINMEVYPEVPDNYCLTTPDRIKVDGVDGLKTYAFGFKAC